MESEVHAQSPGTNESQQRIKHADRPRLREHDVDQFEVERNRRSHMPKTGNQSDLAFVETVIDRECQGLVGGCVVRLG